MFCFSWYYFFHKAASLNVKIQSSLNLLSTACYIICANRQLCCRFTVSLSDSRLTFRFAKTANCTLRMKFLCFLRKSFIFIKGDTACRLTKTAGFHTLSLVLFSPFSEVFEGVKRELFSKSSLFKKLRSRNCGAKVI